MFSFLHANQHITIASLYVRGGFFCERDCGWGGGVSEGEGDILPLFIGVMGDFLRDLHRILFKVCGL